MGNSTKMKSTITIPIEDIKIAIKKYLIEEKNLEVIGDISFIISKQTEGFGMGEHTVNCLESASCKVEL